MLAEKWLLPLLLLITSVCIFVPFIPFMPAEGLDQSWMFGVNQALAQNLTFGRDMIFTFGPYASIYTKVFHPATDNLMVWSSLYLGFSFGIATLVNFKGSKWYLQVSLLIVLASILYTRDPLLLYYPLLVGVYAYKSIVLGTQSDKSAIHQRLLLNFLFIPFGILPLIKGSALLLCAAIFVLVFFLFAIRRNWKDAALLCFTSLCSLTVFWLIAGQPLSGLPFYFISLAAIISGYSEAMAMSGNILEIVGFVIAGVIFLWVVFQGNKSDVGDSIVLLLIFSAVLFMTLKGGFVRHDWHAVMAGTMLLLTALLINAMYSSRGSIVAFFVACAAWAYIDSSYMHTSVQSVLSNTRYTYQLAWYGLKLRVDGKEPLMNDFREATAGLHAKSGFPKLQGTTDIYSFDQSYLIASGNVWNPRPILQSYSAYTPGLIEKNKMHLIGNNSPDNLILKVQPIDGRMPSLEDGASWPVMLSNYQPTEIRNDFLFLKKYKSDQENPESVVSKGSYSLGETVNIPVRNAPVFVKLNVKQSILGKILSVVFKPSQLVITLNMENGSPRGYRIVSGMTKTGFLVSPLIENAAEFGLLYAGVDYLEDKAVKSFSIDANDGKQFWDTQYDVEFLALDLPSQPQIIKRYGLEQPVLVEPNEIIANAEACDGSIDVVNGVSSAASYFLVDTLLSVNGWLAKSVDKGLLPDSVRLVLSEENGRRYSIPVRPVLRPDVGMYFNKSQLDAAGYSVTADVSALQGQYTLGVAYVDNGVVKLCPQFKIPAKFTGRLP